MNDYLLSILLGVIEGLTEFLPVSSTAHLRIAEALFQIDLANGFWKMYSVVIQLGAVLALTAFFWRRILKFLRTFPRGERGDRTIFTHPISLVLIAFVVTAIPAFLLSKLIGKNLENLYVMAFSLLIGGIVMWVVDTLFVKPRITHMEETNLPTAIWIGAVQVLSAVFPGTSRSMCTIAAGQVAGMSREAALEFSFFLSIPTMFVATAYDLLKTLKPHGATETLAPLTMTPHLWVVLGLGFVSAFVVALAVVAWFLHWVRRHGFTPFAIYRIVLGLILLGALARGMLGR
ncbi:MAG: undecaprenyl-diphosphate phosphatase [Chthoniobacterales bacterium]|nr:undecaprenyl-diphosphate phosphatase [Chthoniobacterales bacterium]